MSSAHALTGMFFMAAAGIGVATMLAASAIAKERFHLPYCYLMGAAQIAVGVGLATASAIAGNFRSLTAHHWKWAVLRGAFGMASFAASLLAVACGSPLGDTMALESINIVVSALLARAFLGESLRCPHIAALCLSVFGACLISKPESLFGGRTSAAPWLGYSFALIAGFVTGAAFIAARKSQGVSPLVLASSLTLQVGASHFILGWCGIIQEIPMTRLLAAPSESIAMFAVFLVISVFTAGTATLGSQMCPAAVSSTVYTSTSMSMSFAAQLLLYPVPPELLTVAGAAVMLFAVSLMAFAHRYYSPSTAFSGSIMRSSGEWQVDAFSVVAASPVSARADIACSVADDEADDDTQSLATFVASEMSGVSKGSIKTARLRRAPADVVPPQQLGHAGA